MCTPYGYFESYSSIASIPQLSSAGVNLLLDEGGKEADLSKDVSAGLPLILSSSARVSTLSATHESNTRFKDLKNSNKRAEDNPISFNCRSALNPVCKSDVKREESCVKSCSSVCSSLYSVDSTYSSRNSKGQSGHYISRGFLKARNQMKMSKSSTVSSPKTSSSSVEEFYDQTSAKTANFLKFPQKLWNIINDCKNDAIRWGPSGDTILINYDSFQEEYLCENRSVFKTRNVASFIRQLNLYGFRKVNHNHSQTQTKNSVVHAHEFKHNCFKLGREDLLSDVTRKYSGSKGDHDDDGEDGQQSRSNLNYRVVKRTSFSDQNKRKKNGKYSYKNGTVVKASKQTKLARESVESDAEMDSLGVSTVLKTNYESEELMDESAVEVMEHSSRSHDDPSRDSSTKVEKCQKVLEDVLNKQKEAFKGERQLDKTATNVQLRLARKRRKYVCHSKKRGDRLPKKLRASNSCVQSSNADDVNPQSYSEKSDPFAADDHFYWSSSKGSQSSHSSGNVTLILDPSTTPTKTNSYKRQQIIEDLVYDSVLDQFDHLLGAGDSLAVVTPPVFATLEEEFKRGMMSANKTSVESGAQPAEEDSQDDQTVYIGGEGAQSDEKDASPPEPKVIVANAYENGNAAGDQTAAYGSFYAEDSTPNMNFSF